MAKLYKIKELQAKGRIEFKELAENIGMTTQGLRVAIKNEKIMSDSLEKIAKFFNVPVGYFFDDPAVNQINQVANGNFNQMGIALDKCNHQLELLQERIDGLKKEVAAKDKIISLLEKGF